MRVSKRKLTNDPVLLRIISALKDIGKTEKQLIEYLGMVRGTFTSWRYQNVKSYMSHIDEISEYLSVSPNYLLRGIDDEVNFETLSEAEIQLLKKYRSADENGKSFILAAAGYVIKSHNSPKDFHL